MAWYEDEAKFGEATSSEKMKARKSTNARSGTAEEEAKEKKKKWKKNGQ